MGLKQKIKRNELTIGSWITVGHPSIAEIMAKAGFDWLAIDMEHGPLDFAQCQELIRVIDLCGTPPLVRVGANEPLLIKQAMDAGAHGVIVPMVNSADEARRAVSAVKYPPHGTRGVGLARAQGYGQSFEEYVRWVEKESIVIVQVEHVRAVECVEEILSVEGIDTFVVGPYDLSGSLGKPGRFEDPQMNALWDKIGQAARKLNMTQGYHVVSSDSNLVQAKIKDGYRFLAYGVDFLFLGNSMREGLISLRKSKLENEQKL